MAYKGTATAWMRSLDLGEKENWIREPAMPDGPIANNQILRSISCPKCGLEKNVEKYKVYGKVGFSRIMCMRCKTTTIAQECRRGCKLPWPKCEVHTLTTLMHAIQRCKVAPGRGKVVKRVPKTCMGRMRLTRNVDVREARWQQQVNQYQRPNRTMLKAGSLLAKRFPGLFDVQLKEAAR